jgi:hypothetical protein
MAGNGKLSRSRTVTIRMNPANHQAAERVAALTGRTVSSLAEQVLVEYMRREFPQAFMVPTYYTAHPDGVFRPAEPQPVPVA